MSNNTSAREVVIDDNDDIDIFRQRPSAVPQPADRTCSRDRVIYRAVHFYGMKLHLPLAQAAAYLRRLEEQNGRAPHVLCIHDEYSWEDESTDLAWRVTLVLSELPPDFA